MEIIGIVHFKEFHVERESCPLQLQSLSIAFLPKSSRASMCEEARLGSLRIFDRASTGLFRRTRETVDSDPFAFKAARTRLHQIVLRGAPFTIRPLSRSESVTGAQLCVFLRSMRIFEKIPHKTSGSLRSIEDITVTHVSFVKCLNYNFFRCFKSSEFVKFRGVSVM